MSSQKNSYQPEAQSPQEQAFLKHLSTLELEDNIDAYEFSLEPDFDTLLSEFGQIPQEAREALVQRLDVHPEFKKKPEFLRAALSVADALNNDLVPDKDDVAICLTTIEDLQEEQELDQEDQQWLGFYSALYNQCLGVYINEALQEGETELFLECMEKLVRMNKLYPQDEFWKSPEGKDLLEYETMAHMVNALVGHVDQKAQEYINKSVEPQELKAWLTALMNKQFNFLTRTSLKQTLSYTTMTQEQRFGTLLFVLCTCEDRNTLLPEFNQFYTALAQLIDTEYASDLEQEMGDCAQECCDEETQQ